MVITTLITILSLVYAIHYTRKSYIAIKMKDYGLYISCTFMSIVMIMCFIKGTMAVI